MGDLFLLKLPSQSIRKQYARDGMLLVMQIMKAGSPKSFLVAYFGLYRKIRNLFDVYWRYFTPEEKRRALVRITTPALNCYFFFRDEEVLAQCPVGLELLQVRVGVAPILRKSRLPVSRQIRRRYLAFVLTRKNYAFEVLQFLHKELQKYPDLTHRELELTFELSSVLRGTL